jgi:capsular polysaccharide biosynthesis protein
MSETETDTDTNPVYILENRGIQWIGHWILYIVAGLKDIYAKKGVQKIHIPSPQIPLRSIQYVNETLDLLSHKLIHIDDISNCRQIHHHGTPLLASDKIGNEYHAFLRDLFLELSPIPEGFVPTRRLYISRNKGEQRRQIVNESEVYNMLTTLGFEYIQLENYTVLEKIKLFQEASVIVTPNGAGLVMAHGIGPHTRIIEIHDSLTSREDHHLNMANALQMQFHRYTNVRSVDRNGNPMHPYLTASYNLFVNEINDFYKFVESHIVT